MNSKIYGKKILLFSQYFFGYEKKIAEKMREYGAEVSLYDEMSVTSAFERALLKISPNIFSRKTEQYYGEILNKESQNEYDYILFIDCEMPTENVLKKYKDTFKKAKFCLHMWDSLENLKGVNNKFRFFDYISTFDRNDANNNNLVFRPLFYCDDYRTTIEDEKDYEYNLSFIGTIHSDRYAIIKKLKCEDMYIYPYLQSRFIYYFYKITRPEFRGVSIQDFKFEKIESAAIAEIVRKSKAVLDIQHPKQTGLTMRTLEMLGMKKKFITTNKDIINYDFYDENNICVIDRESPFVPDSFYETDYRNISEETYEFYSIGQWVLDVLGVNYG